MASVDVQMAQRGLITIPKSLREKSEIVVVDKIKVFLEPI